jgi:AraC-like DNA-binding protein
LVEPRRQFGFWREAVCRAFLQLTVDCPSHDEFRGRIDSRPVGGVVLNRVNAQQTVRLDRSGLARGAKNCFYINFQAAGAGVIRQGGREALIGTGEWYVLDSTTPFELLYDKDFASFNVEIDQSLLGAEARSVRGMVGRGFGSRPGLESYLADHALLFAAHRHRAPVAEKHPRPIVHRSVVPHQRRRHRLGAIGPHIADAGLKPAAIAAACHVSVRRLHDLFAMTGETVMQHIRKQRLLLAYDKLNRSSTRGQTITQIALDCGFADSSHFCHAFKAMFQKTPREVRSGG